MYICMYIHMYICYTSIVYGAVGQLNLYQTQSRGENLETCLGGCNSLMPEKLFEIKNLPIKRA